MTSLQIFPPNEFYVTIPSIDGIPIPEKLHEAARKVISKSKNSDVFYSEKGRLKSKHINKNFLLFSPDQYDSNTYISLEGFNASLYADGTLWMTSEFPDINQLNSQFHDATGDVLVAGLGLGITALLAATKKEVTSVTVLETNTKVIELFNRQPFSKNKITIINEDIFKHSGSYDTVLCDYYNVGSKTAMELANMIEDDYDRISVNINSNKFNFYGWEYAYTTYEDYKLSPLVKRTEDEFNKLVSIYNSFDLTKETEKAITFINDNITIPSYFTSDYLNKEFDRAIKLVKKEFAHIISSDVFKDYAIFRIGDTDVLAYGVTWNFNEKTYSAKITDSVITDLYEIFTDKRSAEIDPVTLEIKYMYEVDGANKTDLDGNVVQVNHRVNQIEDLPIDLYRDLRMANFPYINNIFYWAEKPYGTIIEFSAGSL